MKAFLSDLKSFFYLYYYEQLKSKNLYKITVISNYREQHRVALYLSIYALELSRRFSLKTVLYLHVYRMLEIISDHKYIDDPNIKQFSLIDDCCNLYGNICLNMDIMKYISK